MVTIIVPEWFVYMFTALVWISVILSGINIYLKRKLMKLRGQL